MDLKYGYRCPFCGKWHMRTQGVDMKFLRKLEKLGELDPELVKRAIVRGEVPTFDLINPEKDTIVVAKHGKAVVEKFTLLEALVYLPETERSFLLRKLNEIDRQYKKLFGLLKR